MTDASSGREGGRMVANRWHKVKRLGSAETATASGAALGSHSYTFEARKASTDTRKQHGRLTPAARAKTPRLVVSMACDAETRTCPWRRRAWSR